MDILYLSNEGLSATIIESQVLSVARLSVRAGLEVGVVVLSLDEARYQDALRVKTELEERFQLAIHVLRGTGQLQPGSVETNARRVAALLDDLHATPRLIQGRTEFSAAIAVVLRDALACRVIWDCRGDTIGELVFRWRRRSPPLRLLSKLGEWRLQTFMRRARRADGAIFVSEALHALESSRGYTGVATIVPNFADPGLFRFDPLLRDDTRRRLDIPAHCLVFVYVGSLAPWQGIDAMKQLLEQLMKPYEDACLLVVSNEPEHVDAQFSDWPGSRTRSVRANLTEVPAYLNAADVALLLRAEGPASEVASPIKFAEYAMCGLPVIHNDSVEQVRHFSATLGNGVSVHDAKTAPGRFAIAEQSDRSALAGRAADLLSNENTGRLLTELYTPLLSANPVNPATADSSL